MTDGGMAVTVNMEVISTVLTSSILDICPITSGRNVSQWTQNHGVIAEI